MSDLINRQDALNAFGLSEKTRKYGGDRSGYNTMRLYVIQDVLEDLPSAEPEIIYCKDCKRHNVSVEEWYDDHEKKVCPLVSYRGKARGHEFDYQYCVYAERKEDE